MMYKLTPNVTVYEREDWRARRPKPMVDGNVPREAFLHHSADNHVSEIVKLKQQIAHMRGVQAFHMDERDYSDIAYAYVVFEPYGRMRHARVFEGRHTRFVPAGQLNHNQGTAPICVVGRFDDHRLHEQTIWMIVQLLTRRPEMTGLGHLQTIGAHRDVVSTECPGRAVEDLPEICRLSGLRRYGH